MKKAVLGLMMLSALPLSATTPLHPYTASVRDIHAILTDKQVQKRLATYNERVTSVTNEMLKSGHLGWVISTDKCELEVDLAWKASGITSLPGPFNARPVVTIGDCR